LRIAVCVKRVIDMETRFRIAPDGVSVDESGAKYDINDFDLYAIEAALQLKERSGAGEVVALSLGPAAVQETIRKALSMGVDAGIHLECARVPFDSLAIAHAIASALRGRDFDLILFGRKSIDSANEAVGPMVAELLDIACVPAVSGLDMNGRDGKAERAIEGARELGLDATKAAAAAATGALKGASEVSVTAVEQVRNAVTGVIAGVKVVVTEPFKSPSKE